MKRKLKLTTIGVSGDLGFFAETNYAPHNDIKLWLFLARIIPAIVLWAVSMPIISLFFFISPKQKQEFKKAVSRRLFNFLMTDNNMHQTPEVGYLDRLRALYQCEVEVTNLSRIGNSLKTTLKYKHEIPAGQDLFFIHLGTMELLNKTNCFVFKSRLNHLLRLIGKSNPDAHIVFFGLPECVTPLTDERNRLCCVPVPFAPSIEALQKMEGFLKWGVRPGCSEAKITWAYKLQSTYCNIIQHELRSLRKSGTIASFSYIDNREAPIFGAADRHRYFAIDGVHPSTEGHAKLAEYNWPYIAAGLDYVDIKLDVAQESVPAYVPQPLVTEEN